MFIISHKQNQYNMDNWHPLLEISNFKLRIQTLADFVFEVLFKERGGQRIFSKLHYMRIA